jgi:hypothetical protein
LNPFRAFGCLLAIAAAAAAVHAASPPLLARHALVLERNQGQAPVKVRYLARHGAAGVFFTADGVSFVWPKASDEPAQVEWRLVGAAAGVEPVGRNPLPSRSNYFTGSHPSQWVREVENDAEVVYPRVYPGVDLVFHDAGGDLEHDFRIAPGDSRFVVDPHDAVRFRLGAYDRSRALVIDPVFGFSTYLAGTGGEQLAAVTTDAAGNVYVTGSTY